MKKLIVFFLPFLVSCVYHDLANPIDCSTLALSLGSVKNATSCSTTDGTIDIVATGGQQPYTYLLNDVPQTENQFSNLRAGIYSVGVRDANGCDSVITNIQVMAQDFSFTATVGQDTECLSNNGSIQIDVEAGSPPYTFQLDGGTVSSANTFTGLATGSHTILVQDVNACTIALNVTVPRGNTGVSWTTDIKPLMNTYCARSGCHNGVSREDLRQYDVAKKWADKVRDYTQDKSMPFGDSPSLTQAQIDIIACWVDDGAVAN